ncbi:MAG TPA: amidohydrolase family protein [Acidimicrobiales bacterium]|nr:amidohydrolase family protein [Acidimicrobiales bacterium]
MADKPDLVLRDVELDGRLVDVRVAGGVVAEVGSGLRPSPRDDAELVDGAGGALVPGLHDHHIHLLATAAARRSVAAGPADVGGRAGLAAALRAAGAALPPGRWVRAVGYHASVAGDLDRRAVDALLADRPVRIQHRSGARWVLNSAAVDALGLDDGRDDSDRPGVERDAAGRATGRLHRADTWLRPLVAEDGPPDLAALGALLAGRGVTGVTDTTPYADLADLAPLSAAARAGSLPQRVVVTGGPELAGADPPDGLEWGPVKLVIDDADYPALEALAGQVGAAHGHGRSVAIHCVTRAALVLALAAWEVAGARPGDRVEHGAVIPPELVPDLRRHGLTVVTQPGFVAERGDEYRAEVDAADLPHLYPCRSLIAAGVAVAGSTDAPYSDPDPWRAVAAAVARRTRSGAVLDAGEAVTPRRALDLFLSGPQAPGGPPRRVVAGAAADLCLLDRPLGAALAVPASLRVACTIRRGRISPRPS